MYKNAFFAFIVLAVSPISIARAAQPPAVQNVQVTNTAATPVPVQVQGTPSVNVGSLPSVSGSVAVTNPSTNPVPVRAMPAPRSQTFAAQTGLFAGGNAPCTNCDTEVLLTVPAGKAAIIESLSVQVTTYPGVVPIVSISVVSADLQTTLSNTWVALVHEGTGNNQFFSQDVFVGTHAIRIDAPAGATVQASLFIPASRGFGDSTGQVLGSVYANGYYVDTP